MISNQWLSGDGGRKQKTDLYVLSYCRSHWLNCKNDMPMKKRKKEEEEKVEEEEEEEKDDDDDDDDDDVTDNNKTC